MTSLKTSIKTITYLSDIGCLEIQGASLFQFNISRYSQQQLMETSHRHLLHAEEGTWLNIDGFHMGIGGDDSWSPSVSAEFQLSAGRYHYQLVWCQK